MSFGSFFMDYNLYPFHSGLESLTIIMDVYRNFALDITYHNTLETITAMAKFSECAAT